MTRSVTQKKMELATFTSGLIDEIFADRATVIIEKVGITKYRFRIDEQDQSTSFILWTTKKGVIDFSFPNDHPPWLSIKYEGGALQELKSPRSHFHFEHLDRGIYSLAISYEEEDWGCTIKTDGYLKTKIEKGV